MTTTNDVRNRERRQRYATDPDYREKVVQATRDRYRRDVGLKLRRGAKGFDLRRIGQYCERSLVKLPGQYNPWPMQVMTVQNLSVIVGRKTDVVRRWIGMGMLPRPIIKVVETGMMVYTKEEAREIVHVMRQHQEVTPYFRSDHDDTIDLLAGRLNEVRTKL